MATTKYFFDIPVYRISEEQYYREQNEYVEKILFPDDSPVVNMRRELDKADPTREIATRDYFYRLYGGCWRYNEIIGYIRLHFLGSQVRGEYFAVDKKRVIRTRTKTLEYKTWKLAPEVDISHPISSSSILEAIMEYLSDCKKELPKRYIDTELFETIARHVDWRSLFLEP